MRDVVSDIAMSGGYTVPSIDLKAYARRGAEARIAELTAELNDIYKAFPTCELVGQVHRKGAGGGSRTPEAPRDDGGSEGGSVEADEEVLGGEESEEGLDSLDTRRHRLQ